MSEEASWWHRASLRFARCCSCFSDQRDHHLVIVSEQESIRHHIVVAALDLVLEAVTGLDLGEIPEQQQTTNTKRTNEADDWSIEFHADSVSTLVCARMFG